MKVIQDKYDKKKIATLPRMLFEGRVIVIFTERDAEKAVDYLMTQAILGFDTETKPTFTKGKTHQVALLQVSTNDTCFLFRLNKMGLTDSIVRLLEDQNVLKVGLSLQDDMRMLNQRRPGKPRPMLAKIKLRQMIQQQRNLSFFWRQCLLLMNQMLLKTFAMLWWSR